MCIWQDAPGSELVASFSSSQMNNVKSGEVECGDPRSCVTFMSEARDGMLPAEKLSAAPVY